MHRSCCRFPADRGTSRAPTVKNAASTADARIKHAKSVSSSPRCCCTRQSSHHKSRLGCRLNAGDAQWAERHGCRESRPRPWMADGGVPTERRRSEGTTTKESPNQDRTLGYLVSFQVTRRRRNASAVRQNKKISTTPNNRVAHPTSRRLQAFNLAPVGVTPAPQPPRQALSPDRPPG
jgi:hypothetical protein